MVRLLLALCQPLCNTPCKKQPHQLLACLPGSSVFWRLCRHPGLSTPCHQFHVPAKAPAHPKTTAFWSLWSTMPEQPSTPNPSPAWFFGKYGS